MKRNLKLTINPEQQKALNAYREYLNFAAFNHESGMSSEQLFDAIDTQFSRMNPSDVVAITLGFYRITPTYPIGTFVVFGEVKDVGRIIKYSDDYSTFWVSNRDNKLRTSAIKREAHQEEIQQAVYQEQIGKHNPADNDIVILANGQVATYGDTLKHKVSPIIGLFKLDDMIRIATHFQDLEDAEEDDEIIPETKPIKPRAKPRRVRDFNPVPKPSDRLNSEDFNQAFLKEITPHEADTTED